ncbi:MEF2-activating motif and SAP domain-containing transcriptional regulator isoform X2 [Artibeus jamaicensis]|uniref:MEF2-activating motif and SAP domain-containing transcriptional regulator isoform X2 n=1 Tax=Artibeus jamaicensis TaxID=9417 RepID=UPI00235B220E|nr:MEF2-activating motif and SAP domain-containing transcriptional regulator isoform X2 [Artibeus jamaicensis]
MTLAASSQRSQIIRSKFRSVLQLRIHRRYQDPSLSGSFTASPVSESDPRISASGPALAPSPASPLGPAPFFSSPGVLHPESQRCPWKSLKKESPKISQHWREAKPKGNLTYHQYIPPEPRQGSRADPQAKGLAEGPPGPPLCEETKSQKPPSRMKPTPLPPSLPGVSNPSSPSHKLELQTLKLEELTVSELRQQLRLRGLPVSGTKSMLLERMRGGAPSRERPKPRREECPAGAPWPRLRPKALVAARRQGSSKPSSASPRPPVPCAAGNFVTAPALPQSPSATPAPALTSSSAPASAALTLEEELQEAIRRAQLLPNRGIEDILEDQVESDGTPWDMAGDVFELLPISCETLTCATNHTQWLDFCRALSMGT